MSARSQAQPAEATRAADTGSGADITDPDAVQALLVDIFALTGQKVQRDDPLVAAALIHSALLRRAGEDAARAIEQAARRAHEPQPPDHERPCAFGGLAPSPRQIMLGAVLFVICLLGSALGNLLAATGCN